MIVSEYGNPSASTVLIQMIGEHNLASIEQEVLAIQEKACVDFRFLAFQVAHWNADLSPWHSPAVYGKEDFGGRAADTLSEVLRYCTEMQDGTGQSKTYYIGGYSLAGLFALWAAHQTDLFQGVAATSPSLWFPGFVEYMKAREVRCNVIYLSLGDKESKTRNPVMATVGKKICETYAWLKDQGKTCILEWNPGNHFKDADLRMVKAFAWVLKQRA